MASLDTSDEIVVSVDEHDKVLLDFAQTQTASLSVYVDRFRKTFSASPYTPEVEKHSKCITKCVVSVVTGQACAETKQGDGNEATEATEAKEAKEGKDGKEEKTCPGVLVKQKLSQLKIGNSFRKEKSGSAKFRETDSAGDLAPQSSQSSSVSSTDLDSAEYLEDVPDSDDESVDALQSSPISSPTTTVPVGSGYIFSDEFNSLTQRDSSASLGSSLSSLASENKKVVDMQVQMIVDSLFPRDLNTQSVPLLMGAPTSPGTVEKAPDETDSVEDLLARGASSLPANYSSDLAKLMIHFTTASYCRVHNACHFECGCYNHVEGFRYTKRVSNAKYDASGFVGIDESQGFIVTAFRGTVSLKNWINNLRICKITAGKTADAAFQTLPSDVTVHVGFLETFSSIADEMIEEVMNLHRQYPSFKLYVTGHSRGGAKATLCALHLALAGISGEQIYLYTFGSPRVGNQAFAREVNSRLVYNFRVVNNYDLVPALPLRKAGFHHVGEELWFSSSLKRAQIKAYLEKHRSNRSIDVITEAGLMDMCSNTVPFSRLTIVDHLLYFDRITGIQRLRGARPPLRPVKSDGRVEVVSENFSQYALNPNRNVLIWEYMPRNKCCKNKKPFKEVIRYVKEQESKPNAPPYNVLVIQVDVKANDLPEAFAPKGNTTVYFKPAGPIQSATPILLNGPASKKNLIDLIETHKSQYTDYP
mmetsp:Transcript_19692/g.33758  ORF Transcript_19692/g.33758 Transcript_19692/m.33758 type:complete len:703 (-) Transcript_19692:709-2817(-)